MASQRLMVSGFPEGTTEAELMMYFQSRKKSGGGDIAKIKMEEGRRAVITFEEEGVAQRVCSRKFQALRDAKLQVSLNFLQAQNIAEGSHSMIDSNQWEPSTPEDPRRSIDARRDSSTAEEEANTQVTQQGASCRVEVTGLSKITSADCLCLYFENRRSSGGPVDDVEINQKCGTAIVTFESAEVARRVAERTDHMLHNRPITVSLLPKEEPEFEELKNEDPRPAETERCLSFLISNLSSATTEDTLRYYFENAKRSGGGEIQELKFYPDEGVAELSFAEVADYERLVGQEHRLEGQTLSIEIQEPEKGLPLDTRNLYVEGLNPQTYRDCLIYYLEKFSVGVEVESIQFGPAGRALVTFKAPPDFDYMIEKVNSFNKGLEGFHPRARRSPVCSSIKVTGLSTQTTEERLILHFESRRNSGGDVHHVDYEEGSDSAIVYFKDVQTVERVLKKQDHSLHSKALSLELYHPILEEGPQNRQRSGRTRQTKPQKVLAVDRDIVSFIEEFHEDELGELLESLEVSMIPDKSADSVVISSSSVGRGNHVQSSWAERAEAITKFLNAFTKTSIDLGEDVAVEVQKRMRETELLKEENFLEEVNITFSESGGSVQFIGRENYVSEAIRAFHNVARSVEDDLQVKRTLTQSEDKDIPKDMLQLLEMSGYCLELEKKRRYLKIEVGAANGHIKLSGPEVEIKEAMTEIYKTLIQTKTLVLEMPERCLRVLFSPQGRSYTRKSFQERNIAATVSPGQRGIKNEAVVLGLDDGNARQAESLLQTLYKEFNTPLEDGQLPLTNGEKWKELVSQVQFQSLVSVNVESNMLWVSGVSSEASRSFQQLKDFLVHNRIVEQVIQMPKGCSRFLVTAWRSEVDQITRKNSTTWSHASDGEEDGNGGIIISGNAESLTKCVEEIQNLASKIKCDNISVDKPGMGKLFSKVSGGHLLRGVEDKNRCTIERIMDVDEPTETPLLESAYGGTDSSCTCTYVTRHGKKISVYKDDLTKHHVDAIVNAANDRLQHVGGLAAAVVKEGGKEIQEECEDHIRRRGGPLVDGRVFVSGPGKLPCKQIIHAVGPKWNAKATEGEKTRQENMLAYAITNCLKKASSLSSIAIPAVSSGVYGFPLGLCASVIIDAVADFFDENPTCRLSEVHLTNNDDRTVSTFTDKMRKKFGKEESFHEHGAISAETISATNAALPIARRSSATNPKQPLTTAEGVKISVQVGDLTNVKADVLVGSCGSTLQLNNNPCARALSQAAGPGLQQECSTKGTVKEGGIAQARPHGLQQCKAVYFAVCSSWNGGKGEKVLMDLFRKCLAEAHNSNMASIAFPSIGTGVLGFPRATVAKVYFDQAIAFSAKHPRTPLKEIKFVPFDKDINTVTAFTGELSKRASRGPSQIHNTEGGARRRWVATPVFSRVKERALDHLQVNVGPICFQVQAGDITKETTDAIVVVSNPDLVLKLGGGAGAAILREGGTFVQMECAAMGQQSPGAVVRTSSGNLNAKFIFHIVPSQKATMKETIVKCLQLAESSNIGSISFPAVGTGNVGMEPKDCAELLLTSVETFSQRNPKSLQLVRVVIFQPDTVDAFRSVMKMKSGEESPSEHWMTRTAKKFVSYLSYVSDRKDASQAEMLKSAPADIKMSLKVFAGTRLNVDRAIKEIRELMNEHCKQKFIINEATTLLSEDHERRIRTAALRHGTKVEVERPIGRIVIRGNSEDILEVAGEIHEILDEIKEDQRKRYQEDLLAKSVEWEYKEGAKFEKYPKDVNLKIETAHTEGKKKVTFVFEGHQCEIDFEKMEERCPTAPSVVDVRRRDVKDLAVPAHWAPQPLDSSGNEKKVHLVKLNSNMREYRLVEQHFQSSMQGTSTIISIDRVQNPGLNGIYETKKAKMDEGKGSNEMKLFHGTAGKNLDKINAYGFNRSYAGAHAVMYGSGVYFAVQATYSARPTYSPPDGRGLRYMYLAKVLVGEYAVGKQGLVVPPSKNDPNNPNETHDTAVDQVPNPNIIVTFYDWQCYPEYLITFK